MANLPYTESRTTWDPKNGMTPNAAGAVTTTREIIGEAERAFSRCEADVNECREKCTFNDTGEPVASLDYCGDPNNNWLPRVNVKSMYSKHGSAHDRNYSDPCKAAVEKLGREGLESLNELKEAEQEQMATLSALTGGDPAKMEQALEEARESRQNPSKRSPAQISPVATENSKQSFGAPLTDAPTQWTPPGSAQVIGQPNQGTPTGGSPAIVTPVATGPTLPPPLPLPNQPPSPLPNPTPTPSPTQLPSPGQSPGTPHVFALPNPIGNGGGGGAQPIPQPTGPGAGVVGTNPIIGNPSFGGPAQISVTPASVQMNAQPVDANQTALASRGVSLENGPSLFNISSSAYHAFCRGGGSGPCGTIAP